MLFNGRALIFTFSRTQVRIAEHERLQSLFKTSMTAIEQTLSVENVEFDGGCELQRNVCSHFGTVKIKTMASSSRTSGDACRVTIQYNTLQYNNPLYWNVPCWGHQL